MESNHYLLPFLSIGKSTRALFLTFGLLAGAHFAYSQTCTAPNQCMATPGFGEAPASHTCPESSTATEIFLEDFDNGFGIFTEVPPAVGANDLTVSTAGDTPSFGTGPETTAGCDGSSNDGEFIFLEGSFHLAGEMHCMEASIDIPAVTPTLSLPFTMSFWYHMFGDNIGTMDININGNNEFTVSGQQQTANCQNWLQGDIDVSAFAGTTITMTVCMSEGNGSISTFESDISIDHIQIFGCQPKNFLPEGWESADIGNTISENCYLFDTENGEYSVVGGGNNATSTTTDNVAFAYQELCGDVSITAKIEDVSSNGYGGLMIRETSAAGARQVSLFSNLSYVLRHESRSFTNAPKTVNAFFKPSPTWLKLERQGDWIFAYYSSNGVSFSYVHAVYVPMSYCVQVGLASFTYSPTMTSEAIFSNVSTTGAGGALMETDVDVTFENAEVSHERVTSSLFPNPASSYFTVQLSQPLTTASQLVLRNAQGQQVGLQTLQAEALSVDWDISTIPAGLYYLEIHNNGTLLEIHKMIKK